MQLDSPPVGIVRFDFANQKSDELIVQAPGEQVLSVAHFIENQLSRVVAAKGEKSDGH